MQGLVGNVCVSIVTYAELMYGVERSSTKRVNLSVINDFIAQLETNGTPIGIMDMMIVAHAKSEDDAGY